MKSWQETSAVFREMARLAEEGRRCALATITKVEGSAYRKPGAKLLVRDDGSLVGNVSGGCLEQDLRERALRVMSTGAPESVHYDTGSDESVVWGLGLGCNGKIDLHLEPGPTADMRDVVAALGGDQPFARTAGAFVETLPPPWQLVVIGGGDDSLPLVRLAATSGFRVTVVDHRSAYLSRDRFPEAWTAVQRRPEAGLQGLPQDPRTLVVVKNHHLQMDKAWAHAYIATPVPYVGLLGPKARRDEILKGITPADLPRIRGPVGVDIGAEGPEQIAVSTVAELLAVAGERNAGFLGRHGTT